MPQLLLIRHGESEGNEAGIIQGQLDTGLTQLGRLQSRHVAEALASLEVAAIVSSPLRRARDTAEAIAGRLNLALSFDDDLMEYDYGKLSGLTRQQIRERYPALTPSGILAPRDGTWPQIPDEEGRDAFLARAARAIERHRGNDGRIVAVTHGGFISAACHTVLGLDYLGRPARFRTANCSITEFVTDRAGNWVLRRHNDDCHIGAHTMPLEA